MTPFSILLADDHRIFRKALRNLLEQEFGPELIVAGEAGDGQELIEQCTQLNPTVVITDISMPLVNGIRATREMVSIDPSRKVIGLTAFDDPALMREMISVGARGFLLKNASVEELHQAIVTVRDDGYHFATHREAQGRASAASLLQANHASAEVLTAREKAVLELICQQMTSAEIASRLHISKRSVEKHRDNMMQKLQVRNVVGLALFARNAGIIPL